MPDHNTLQEALIVARPPVTTTAGVVRIAY